MGSRGAGETSHIIPDEGQYSSSALYERRVAEGRARRHVAVQVEEFQEPHRSTAVWENQAE